MNRSCLKALRLEMYGASHPWCRTGYYAHKLTVKDFPDSFRDNMIFVEPIDFKDSKKIMDAYEELGITPR